METVSWGELKTKSAVQIHVAAGVNGRDLGNLLGEKPRELWVSAEGGHTRTHTHTHRHVWRVKQGLEPMTFVSLD